MKQQKNIARKDRIMTPPPTNQVNILRIDLTFKIACIGLSVLVVVFLIDFLFLWLVPTVDKTFVSAVTGAIVSAIGTLAGFVAGHTAGAQGKEEAEARAVNSQAQAEAKQKKINKALVVAGKQGFNEVIDLLKPDD
jgi:hypothetical protein